MILFFYGTDLFRQMQDVRALKKSFLDKNPTGGGFILCDFDVDAGAEDVRQALMAQNLFAQKKLLIIKNLFKNTTADVQKDIKGFLQDYSGEDVVLLWEHSQPRKNATLFTWLLKHADQKKEYAELRGAKCTTWVQARVRAEKASISHRAVQTLIVLCDGNTQRLAQEIQKLATFVGEREITTDDVEALVSGDVPADIFAMVEAMASADKAHALTQLHKQKRAKEAPQKILAMYAYQLRILLAVGDAYKNGHRDKNTIARMIKAHPFVVQKALPVVQRISQDRLLRAHTHLTIIDQETKTGKQNIDTALELFVMRF